MEQDKSLAKSKRRHGLKMIDRKWAPVLAKGKAMAQSLAKTRALDKLKK